MLKKYENDERLYFHREVLAHSREGRPMELLTFTGRAGMT